MGHPLRIQRKREKGWRMPPGAVYVGRPTEFGNPFETAEQFRHWLNHNICFDLSYVDFMRLLPQRNQIEKRLDELRGKQLACWCPLDRPCHADVLCEIANRGTSAEADGEGEGEEEGGGA